MNFLLIPKEKMTYSEFLETAKVVRTLYDKTTAKLFFENNLDYYFKKEYNENK